MSRPMTVKDLKALLANLPDETLVILATDAEGNAFSPVGGVSPQARYVEGRRAWETGQLFTPGEPAYEARRGRPAVALWPLH